MGWIRAATLESYSDLAREIGLDPGRMLWRAGINPALLSDPEQRVSGRAAAYLLEISAIEGNCPQLGLLLSERRELATLGPLGLLLQHEPTLGDAAAAIARYQRSLTEALSLAIEDAGETVIIHIGVTLELDHDARQSVELAVASFALALTLVGGERWRPESVHFTQRAPASLTVHQRLFGCTPEFDCGFTGLVYTKAAFALPNESADPRMLRYMQDYLELLRRPDDDIAIDERIRRALLILLPQGRATLDQVGEEIGIHPRTLQRLLEKEGLSFARVLSDARRELAIRYLRTPERPLGNVASLIGFASASSFTRWFRGEFGVPPQTWRAAAPDRQPSRA